MIVVVGPSRASLVLTRGTVAHRLLTVPVRLVLPVPISVVLRHRERTARRKTVSIWCALLDAAAVEDVLPKEHYTLGITSLSSQRFSWRPNVRYAIVTFLFRVFQLTTHALLQHKDARDVTEATRGTLFHESNYVG